MKEVAPTPEIILNITCFEARRKVHILHLHLHISVFIAHCNAPTYAMKLEISSLLQSYFVTYLYYLTVFTAVTFVFKSFRFKKTLTTFTQAENKEPKKNKPKNK